MECGACGNPNDPGRRFCRRCGSALGAFCGRCGFFNATDDDFCGGCGGSFDASQGTFGEAADKVAGSAPPPLPNTPPGPGSTVDDLDKLFDQPPPPPPAAAEPPSAISQTDIDSFFKKLSAKGDAEIRRQPAEGTATTGDD